MTEDDGEEPSDEDPFAETDEDPFADIEGDGASDEDPFAETDEDPFADIEGVEQEDDPFTDLSAGSEDPSTDFGPSDNTLFTDEGATELDEEAVWERLEGGDEDADEGAGESAAPETTPELDAGAAPERAASPEADEERRETVVKKRSYCEQCEYFSEPPAVACTYPDAEIVELVDTSQFRVRNCPIVARRRNNDLAAITEGGGTADPELESGSTVDPELEAGDSGADD